MRLTHQERRVFERCNVEKDVSVTFKGRSQKVKCKNVNTEGLSLYLVESELKIDDEVCIQFDDQDSHFPALNADAEVIRVQTDAGGFLIALEFTAIY